MQHNKSRRTAPGKLDVNAVRQLTLMAREADLVVERHRVAVLTDALFAATEALRWYANDPQGDLIAADALKVIERCRAAVKAAAP